MWIKDSRRSGLSSLLIVLCISGTILSFSPSHRGKIAKCSHSDGYSDRLQFSKQIVSPSAPCFVMSAGAKDIRSKDIGVVGVTEKIRRVLKWFVTLIRHLIRLFIPVASAEKNVRYIKGNSADSDSSRFVRNIKLDAARNDENDGYAESDRPDDDIPEMESVTLASKMESGNKISGSDRKSSVSPEISNVDPRNYKNSQRQEADKSYAERKLMEIETKQIETANNKIKLQNKAEAASKWVLNSLLNSEKSPNRKDFKAADNYETDDDNEVESDDSDRNSNIDTDPIDNIVLGTSNKSKNLLYNEAQVRKLSSSSAPSAGDIKSTAATEESRYTDIMTEERKNSPITTNAISTRMYEDSETIASFDRQDNKPKINEVKKEKIPTRVDPIEVKRTVIKSSITNIDNGALTQTLTAVINEKSSNSYFVKPNLNVILKKSLKDSLYPINPDGTYTTKETVRPIKETSLINDFVRNSIIISEKVEMERRLSRMEETVEIGTESDELKGSSMTEVTNDDDEADALQQKVDGRNSDIVGNEDVLRLEIDDNYDVDVDVHKGESKATVNNTKGITLKEDEKEDENEQENIESKKSIELANGKIILDDEFSTRDQNEKDENIDDSDKENLSIISDKEKYSLPPIGSITKPNMVSSNSAVTTFASAESVSSSSTTLSPPLVTLSASAISDVPPASIPIVTPTLQSLNSSLEKDNKDEIKGEVEVEVVAETESESRVSASSSTYLSTSLPVSADIRTQLISTAAEELGITGGDISIESDEEVNMNEVRDEYTLEANDVERIEDEDEAGTDSAKPAAEYNSFPYYTPPPPPYTNAPRCLLGSWELSETRYIDEARSVVSDSSVEVINIPSFGTVSSSLSGSKGLEWKANKSRPDTSEDESYDEDSNVNGERGEGEGLGKGEEGLALKGVFDEYAVEFNIVRGCSSTEWMKGQGRNERVITARIIKPPKDAFEQKPTLCTYEGVLTSEEYIQGMVFSTPVTVEGERKLVGEFQMNKL